MTLFLAWWHLCSARYLTLFISIMDQSAGVMSHMSVNLAGIGILFNLEKFTMDQPIFNIILTKQKKEGNQLMLFLILCKICLSRRMGLMHPLCSLWMEVCRKGNHNISLFHDLLSTKTTSWIAYDYKVWVSMLKKKHIFLLTYSASKYLWSSIFMWL